MAAYHETRQRICRDEAAFRRDHIIVGGLRKTGLVWTLLLAVAAFVGTSLQMLIALVEAREALAWARAEKELINEQPRLRRRSARKELTSWRDPATDRSLAYVDLVLFSWTLLVVASGGATIAAAGEMF